MISGPQSSLFQSSRCAVPVSFSARVTLWDRREDAPARVQAGRSRPTSCLLRLATLCFKLQTTAYGPCIKSLQYGSDPF
jgi:hypothetical protein